MKEKPHSLKPLSILPEFDADGLECFSHPYAFEIDNFRIPDRQLSKRGPPEQPSALASTPLVMVDSLEGLQEMVAEVSQFTEIAVDLEAHSYRSYLGLTCLIQVTSPLPLDKALLIIGGAVAEWSKGLL